MVTPGARAPGRQQGPPRPTKYARSLMALPGPGALPERTRQRGPGARASSGARAGRAPAPGPAREAGQGPWGRRALTVTLAVLLRVSPRRRPWLGKARLVAGRGRGSRDTTRGACRGDQVAGVRVRGRAGYPGPAGQAPRERETSPRCPLPAVHDEWSRALQASGKQVNFSLLPLSLPFFLPPSPSPTLLLQTG